MDYGVAIVWTYCCYSALSLFVVGSVMISRFRKQIKTLNFHLFCFDRFPELTVDEVTESKEVLPLLPHQEALKLRKLHIWVHSALGTMQKGPRWASVVVFFINLLSVLFISADTELLRAFAVNSEFTIWSSFSVHIFQMVLQRRRENMQTGEF
jgi:hypothetical protein